MKAAANKKKDELYKEYFSAYDVESSKINDLLSICSDHLNLHKFYTAGPEQVSSWLIPKGATAREAAGKIHTDFEKNFICVEISQIEDWHQHGGTIESLKKANKWNKYGKDYIMKDKDVALFSHGAR
jgi:ribosome-binding ATPase YchF (GTP1/OBG family)